MEDTKGLSGGKRHCRESGVYPLNRIRASGKISRAKEKPLRVESAEGVFHNTQTLHLFMKSERYEILLPIALATGRQQQCDSRSLFRSDQFL